jgi:hypothetical protein
MAIFEVIVILLGLIVFEIVNSLDNAIVNAHILKKMDRVWRKRFITIGIFTSVFLVRFLVPFAILWIAAPGIDVMQLFSLESLENPTASEAIEHSKPWILLFGGVFLLYLYFHWLFIEKKHPLFLERFLKEQHGVWFFAFASIILIAIMWFARTDPNMMLAAAIGSTTFFIIYGFKELAEKTEKRLLHAGAATGFSAFMYLEVLDATFSFDGVIGAFAFTTNLLIIIIGIGIGAFVVRELTIRGIEHVGKYRWLKNGAMTAIGFLGLFMVVESFGIEMPVWIPTVVTFALLGIAFYKSHRLLNNK